MHATRNCWNYCFVCPNMGRAGNVVRKLNENFPLSTRKIASNNWERCVTNRRNRVLIYELETDKLFTYSAFQNKLKDHGLAVPKTALNRQLREVKFKSSRLDKKFQLNAWMKRARLRLANHVKNWTVENWQKVCFSLNEPHSEQRSPCFQAFWRTLF